MNFNKLNRSDPGKGKGKGENGKKKNGKNMPWKEALISITALEPTATANSVLD
jgi:hypothetical protein